MTSQDIGSLVAAAIKRKRLPTHDIWRPLRLRANLTQQDIADLVGVSAATVSRWETGTRKPIGNNRVRYAKLLADLEGTE